MRLQQSNTPSHIQIKFRWVLRAGKKIRNLRYHTYSIHSQNRQQPRTNLSTFLYTSNPINLSIHFPRIQHNNTLYPLHLLPLQNPLNPLHRPPNALLRLHPPRLLLPIDLRHRLDAIRRHEGTQRPLRSLGRRLGHAVVEHGAVQLVCASAVGLGAGAEGDVRGGDWGCHL